jgi:hypothetical protein
MSKEIKAQNFHNADKERLEVETARGSPVVMKTKRIAKGPKRNKLAVNDNAICQYRH